MEEQLEYVRTIVALARDEQQCWDADAVEQALQWGEFAAAARPEEFGDVVQRLIESWCCSTWVLQNEELLTRLVNMYPGDGKRLMQEVVGPRMEQQRQFVEALDRAQARSHEQKDVICEALAEMLRETLLACIDDRELFEQKMSSLVLYLKDPKSLMTILTAISLGYSPSDPDLSETLVKTVLEHAKPDLWSSSPHLLARCSLISPLFFQEYLTHLTNTILSNPPTSHLPSLQQSFILLAQTHPRLRDQTSIELRSLEPQLNPFVFSELFKPFAATSH